MDEEKGCEAPRVFTPPLRDLTPETSLGFLFCEFCEGYGFKLVPWQSWLAIHMLEIGEDGLFRFRTVIAIVARQNGKTLFSELLVLFFLFVLQVQMVLGTSLSLDQAEEVWEAVVQEIEGDQDLASELEVVRRANGQKKLKLTKGRAYKVSATAGSASRKGGRGKSVDLLLLDEIREHRDWEAWGATTKATLARPNAITFCISNAGDALSVVLYSLRLKAHAMLGDPDGFCRENGEMPDESDIDESALGWFEWSAPPNADKRDRKAWAQANPSLGYGFITERAIASACATDDDATFRTECLCQWGASVSSPFPDGAWENGTDGASEIPSKEPVFYGVDVSANRTTGTIAACGMRQDGLWHVEVVASRTGTDWMVDWFRQRASKARRMTVAMQGRGAPVSAYVADFEKVDGLSVVTCEGKDLGGWTGRFYDGVAACSSDSASDAVEIMHRPQPVLDGAAGVAQKRSLGDGAFAWDRGRSPQDISPLVACTMAYGAAAVGKTEKARRQASSAYAGGRGLVVV